MRRSGGRRCWREGREGGSEEMVGGEADGAVLRFDAGMMGWVGMCPAFGGMI